VFKIHMQTSEMHSREALTVAMMSVIFLSLIAVPGISYDVPVCYGNFQSLTRLCWLVKRQLRSERCEEPCADSQNRWPSRPRDLRFSLSVCQYFVLRVRIPLLIYIHITFFNFKIIINDSAATKQQILKSGVTVASLFFGEVFGAQAQKALTVFVALR
jgi:hypothetical protein